jgi:hypothetical protein
MLFLTSFLRVIFEKATTLLVSSKSKCLFCVDQKVTELEIFSWKSRQRFLHKLSKQGLILSNNIYFYIIRM